MGNLLSAIRKELNTYKQIRVISFDLFDTLLFRMVRRPESVFEIVGKKAVEKGILPGHISPIVYRNIRKQAEQRAIVQAKAMGKPEDVYLDDILACLPVDRAVARSLSELELETEKEVCFLNPDAAEIFQYLQRHMNYRVIITSDMYLSKQQIQELLAVNDIPLELFDDIYVSSETGVNKRSGSAYQYLLQQCQCSPDEILHIGDNYLMDVVNAQFLGIHAIYYDVISSEQCMDLQMEELKYGMMLPGIYALRRYTSSQAKDLEEGQREWFHVGAAVFGPLMSGMAEWVLDTAEKEKVRKIFPLMREGWIFSKLLKQAAQFRQKEFKIEPMYISRKAVFLPGMGKWDIKAFEKLSEIRHGTVGTVLEMFHLEGTDLQDCRNCPLKDMKHTKTGGRVVEARLKEFLFLPETAAYIEEVIHTEQKNLLEYLNVLGINSDFITLDLGMRGTMQQALSNLCKSKGSGKKRIHLLLFGAYDTLQKLIEGVDIRGYVGYAGEYDELVSEIAQRPYLFEQLLMCDSGTTIAYTETGEPITKQIKGIRQEQFQWVSWCQKGMLAFQRNYLEIKKKKGSEFLKISPQDAAKALLRVMKLPTLEEAGCLGCLQFDENLGVDGVHPLCSKEMISEVETTGIEAYIESHPPGSIGWMEGIVTQVDAAYFFNQILENRPEYEKSVIRLIKKILVNRPEKVVVAGAGEVGRMLQRYLALYGIGIEAFTDQNKKLQGSGLNGIPVRNLADSFVSRHFVIASFAYADEIAAQIKGLKGDDVMIYQY